MSSTNSFLRLAIILASVMILCCHGLSTNTNSKVATTCNKPMNRFTFLQHQKAVALSIMGTATATTMSNQPAQAKSDAEIAALKGTKKDPKYEACLSSCMYDCTKPKGMEQKSRSECLPECKTKCATTKEQLMIGTPVAK